MTGDPRSMAAAVGLAAALLLAGGCAGAPRAAAPVVAASVCPPLIQDLADALARHRARRGAWPATLAELVHAGMLAGVTPADLERCAYAGGSLGVLPDGRSLLLVDGVRQADGSVWCVVQSTGGRARPVMEVVAVPWATLEAAAR